MFLDIQKYLMLERKRLNFLTLTLCIAQLAGAVEYTDCTKKKKKKDYSAIYTWQYQIESPYKYLLLLLKLLWLS